MKKLLCVLLFGMMFSSNPPTYFLIKNVNLSSGTLDISMATSLSVSGFEFYLSGITISNISGGTAYDNFDLIEFNSETGKVTGYSTQGNTIPPVISDPLISLSFTDFNDNQICFNNNGNIVWGLAGTEIPSNFSDCFMNWDSDECLSNQNECYILGSQSGDLNFDGLHNILDIVISVEMILNP